MGLGKKKILSQGASAFVAADNFAPITYTGDGASSRDITVGLKPDFVWIKKRGTSTGNHLLQNTVNGAGTGSSLSSNSTSAAGNFDQYGYVSSFNDDGFTIQGGTSGAYPNDNANESGSTYVAWCWKAGGAAVSNTSGTITSSVSANVAAGFSIVKHTAPSSEQNYTIGHGLGVKPSMVILKGLDSNGTNWFTWHKDLSAEQNYLYLNGDYSEGQLTQDSRIWGQQSFTSDVISTRSNYTTLLGDDYISYCFADVAGYSKIGSYTGTNNTSGPIVTIGFEPSFLLIKGTQSTTQWLMIDNKRSTSNPRNKALFANLADAEGTNNSINFTSTTFQPITTDGDSNRAETYIYLAIA